MIIVAYILPILIIFLGFRFEKSKGISIVILLYIWALMGLNTFTPDYESYETRYNSLLTDVSFDGFDTEWGYKGLNLLFWLQGFNFQEFRMVYGAIYALVTVSVAWRLSNKPNIILSLFLIWPFLPSISGIRQSLASMIVCWGIPYLLEDNRKSLFKYIICVLIAASIHNSVLLYLIFIFARKTILYKDLRIISIVVILLTILSFFSSFFAGIGANFDNNKFEKYLDRSAGLTDHMSVVTFIAYILLLILEVWIVYRLSAIILKKTNNVTTNYEYNLVKRTLLYRNIYILLLFTIPGYTVSGIFQRLLLGMLPISYALYSDFFNNREIDGKSKRKYLRLYYLILLLLMASYIYINYGNHDVFAALKDNMLFN